MAVSEKTKTPKFRVSFPNVFKPRAMSADQEPRYSIVALFEPDADLSNLKRIAKQAVKEQWGDSPPANLRSPFRDQADKADYDGYTPGAIFITAKSKRRPGLVDRNREEILDESDFYGGCYAHMTVVAATYGGPGTGITPGVSFYVNNIQKLADGEPFGNRSRPEDDFEALDPTTADTAESLDDMW